MFRLARSTGGGEESVLLLFALRGILSCAHCVFTVIVCVRVRCCAVCVLCDFLLARKTISCKTRTNCALFFASVHTRLPPHALQNARARSIPTLEAKRAHS